MVWKPKEKEFTQEEAVELAKKEVAHLWHGTTPLFIGVKDDQSVPKIYPLNEEFTLKNWAIIILDPLSLNGESCLQLLMEYRQRYSPLGIQFLAVLSAAYSFLSNKEQLEKIVQKSSNTLAFVLDTDRLVRAAFQNKITPEFLLLAGGKVISKFEGMGSYRLFEGALQKFVRDQEKGLPLLPLFQPAEVSPEDIMSYEFPRDLELPEIKISGNWTKGQDYIETEDSDAQIQFKSTTKFVSILAGPSKELMLTEATRVAIEINDGPVLDLFAGRNLEFDEEGRTVIRCQTANIFHSLKNLTEDQKSITLYFPVAKRIPVRVYAIKFSDLPSTAVPTSDSF